MFGTGYEPLLYAALRTAPLADDLGYCSYSYGKRRRPVRKLYRRVMAKVGERMVVTGTRLHVRYGAAM